MGKETEPGTLRGRPGLGLAPKILTPSPMTGWQDVGKPTSPYFNTISHVTDWFPHAAAQERVNAILSTRLPGLQLRLTAPLATPNLDDGPHSLLPMPVGQAAGQ